MFSKLILSFLEWYHKRLDVAVSIGLGYTEEVAKEKWIYCKNHFYEPKYLTNKEKIDATINCINLYKTTDFETPRYNKLFLKQKEIKSIQVLIDIVKRYRSW